MAPKHPLDLAGRFSKSTLFPGTAPHGHCPLGLGFFENGRRLAGETGGRYRGRFALSPCFTTRAGSNEHNGSGPRPTRPPSFARTLRGTRVRPCPITGFGLLHRACAGHTYERTHPDVTIQTCWDFRPVGPRTGRHHPRTRSRLCTEVAKRAETIRWGRREGGRCRSSPESVESEWGIDLASGPLDHERLIVPRTLSKIAKIGS